MKTSSGSSTIAESSEEKKDLQRENWIKRHPFVTVVLVIIVSLLLLVLFTDVAVLPVVVFLERTAQETPSCNCSIYEHQVRELRLQNEEILKSLNSLRSEVSALNSTQQTTIAFCKTSNCSSFLGLSAENRKSIENLNSSVERLHSAQKDTHTQLVEAVSESRTQDRALETKIEFVRINASTQLATLKRESKAFAESTDNNFQALNESQTQTFFQLQASVSSAHHDIKTLKARADALSDHDLVLSAQIDSKNNETVEALTKSLVYLNHTLMDGHAELQREIMKNEAQLNSINESLSSFIVNKTDTLARDIGETKQDLVGLNYTLTSQLEEGITGLSVELSTGIEGLNKSFVQLLSNEVSALTSEIEQTGNDLKAFLNESLATQLSWEASKIRSETTSVIASLNESIRAEFDRNTTELGRALRDEFGSSIATLNESSVASFSHLQTLISAVSDRATATEQQLGSTASNIRDELQEQAKELRSFVTSSVQSHRTDVDGSFQGISDKISELKSDVEKHQTLTDAKIRQLSTDVTDAKGRITTVDEEIDNVRTHSNTEDSKLWDALNSSPPSYSSSSWLLIFFLSVFLFL